MGSATYEILAQILPRHESGTAEIGVANHFNVWSSVFAPYDNPQIVLVVTAEDVNGLGAVTLPVAHDVLQWYFSKK